MTSPNEELVPVLESGNMAHIAVAEALLRGEGIEFLKANAAMQGLLPVDGFTAEPVRLMVRPEDQESALALLADLEDNPEETEDYS